MMRLIAVLLAALMTAPAAIAADPAPSGDNMGPAAPAQGELAAGLLRASPSFASLSDAAIKGLAELAAPRLVRPGETVVVEGDTTDSLFLLAAGDFAVLRQGNTTPIARLGAGEVIGEYALLTGAARTATIQAIDNGLVFELTRADMLPTLKDNPHLVAALSALMAERLQRNNPQGPAKEAIATELEATARQRLGL